MGSYKSKAGLGLSVENQLRLVVSCHKNMITKSVWSKYISSLMLTYVASAQYIILAESADFPTIIQIVVRDFS